MATAGSKRSRNPILNEELSVLVNGVTSVLLLYLEVTCGIKIKKLKECTTIESFKELYLQQYYG